jgi:hypothetical protein
VVPCIRFWPIWHTSEFMWPLLHAQVGDWGRQGSSNQSEVAHLMASCAAALKPNFVVSTGAVEIIPLRSSFPCESNVYGEPHVRLP